MRRLQELGREEVSMKTIAELTNVFEGLASMRIAQTKNKVLKAQEFFHELWHIYTQLRVDESFRFGRALGDKKLIDKDLFIGVTAEGSFSGDIDQKLIKWMLSQYDPKKHDIIIIGHHGVIQLTQLGVKFKKYFKLPNSDININAAPLIKEIQQYKGCYVYYQTYVSLTIQDVKRINLSAAAQEQGKAAGKSKDDISEANYIFEPSTYEVVSHLEQSMLSSMLGQVIFESKLAQYASRFRAMSSAHKKADESVDELHLMYNRVKRGMKDERLKEIINGMRKARQR
ncbi:MAG: F-type H+-transporting ATPase subunit gamma [Patescibacteria group bacterium]|nr:F-type H+-transporting ATPase subunit gamma [Patescibacteria group bacterium]